MHSIPPSSNRSNSESTAVNDSFTYAVIGKAMETHSALGPGLKEEFYHQDFATRLQSAGIEFASKPRNRLVYRGIVADTFEPDLLFPGQLIGELKALRTGFDAEHYTQILAYQKFQGLATGMLFDFGKESLIYKRTLFTQAETHFPKVAIPTFVTNGALINTILRLLEEIHEAHGVGYRETTYQGLLRATLQAEQIPFRASPTSPIGILGVTELRCIVVDQACAISVTALGDGVSAADRAALQTCLRWLDLPWGLAVHFGKRTVDLRFVSRPK